MPKKDDKDVKGPVAARGRRRGGRRSGPRPARRSRRSRRRRGPASSSSATPTSRRTAGIANAANLYLLSSRRELGRSSASRSSRSRRRRADQVAVTLSRRRHRPGRVRRPPPPPARGRSRWASRSGSAGGAERAMSTRKLLILTGVFLALLAFVVLFERKQPTSEERAKSAKRLSRLQGRGRHLGPDRAPRPAEGGARTQARRTGGRSRASPRARRTGSRRTNLVARPRAARRRRRGAHRRSTRRSSASTRRRRRSPLTFKDKSGRTFSFGQAIPGTDAHGGLRRERASAAVRAAPLAALTKPRRRVPAEAALRRRRSPRSRASRSRKGPERGRRRRADAKPDRAAGRLADREARRGPRLGRVRRPAPRRPLGEPGSRSSRPSPAADLPRVGLAPPVGDGDAPEGRRDRRDALVRRRQGGRRGQALREGRERRRRRGRPGARGPRARRSRPCGRAASSRSTLPALRRVPFDGGRPPGGSREGGRGVALGGARDSARTVAESPGRRTLAGRESQVRSCRRTTPARIPAKDEAASRRSSSVRGGGAGAGRLVLRGALGRRRTSWPRSRAGPSRCSSTRPSSTTCAARRPPCATRRTASRRNPARRRRPRSPEPLRARRRRDRPARDEEVALSPSSASPETTGLGLRSAALRRRRRAGRPSRARGRPRFRSSAARRARRSTSLSRSICSLFFFAEPRSELAARTSFR